jgi:tetratricopeptide (TPR) repeat protein
VVQETLTPVPPATLPLVRFHVEQANRPLRVLTQRECAAQGVCGPDGHLALRASDAGTEPARSGALSTADRFVWAGQPNDARALESPELPSAKLQLEEERGTEGAFDWRLVLREGSDEPVVAWRYPGRLRLSKVTWYRAGDDLWLQLESSGEGLACVPLRARISELVSQAHEAHGLKALRDAKLSEAEERLRKAVAASNARAEAHYNLACVLARSGKLDEAMAALSAAVERKPQELKMLARSDTDLDPLRAREDFKKLVAPLGKAAPP